MVRLAAFLALFSQGDTAAEYKEKLQKIARNAAAKHYSIGEYLATSQMHLWAREQFYKAVELDPDHAGARKKLGYRKSEDGGWESDPSLKQEFSNKKQGDDAERIRKTYNDRLEAAGKDLGRQWADLGNWCKKGKMEAEATDAFKKALENDPNLAAVRKELGFEKDARGGWMSRFERDLRKEMKEGIAKASTGTPSQAETKGEQALGQKHRKRESDHFLIESPHLSDDQLGSLVQHAEHAYALYHKIFDRTDGFNGTRMNFVSLKDRAQHERWVDAFETRGKAHKDLAKKSHGQMGFPVCEGYQETLSEAGLKDWVVHATVQCLSNLFVRGEHHWLHEGMAYYFTRLMMDSAATYCVDLAGTTQGSRGKNYQDPTNWPIVCKVWVREGKDPDINAILKCENLAELDGGETVKAWSIVDFLLVEHREKFIALCKGMKDSNVEKSLKEAFGWSIGDLDQRWRTYVKASY
jgi:tetratricopeptide (TPR) repeat protein